MRAAELAVMDRGDGRLLREAIAVHEQEVECRLQPPLEEDDAHLAGP